MQSNFNFCVILRKPSVFIQVYFEINLRPQNNKELPLFTFDHTIYQIKIK